MTTEKTIDPTCEQLIDERLKDRREWLNPVLDTISQCKMVAGYDSKEIDEKGLEAWQDAAREAREQEISEHVLSIDTTTTYRLCLSYGGPADYLELDWNQGGWNGGRYIYQDWFDGATRNIGPEEAEELAEQFGIHPNTLYPISTNDDVGGYGH